MRRRDFLALAAASAATWPLVARAQQLSSGVKRLAFINSVAESDPAMTPFLASAKQGLASQGWVEGKNLELKYWFAINLADLAAKAATEAADLRPDVCLTVGPVATTAMLNQTRTIPIVFFGIADPIASGLTESLSRPSGNVTGFTQADPLFGAKVAELLKELAPATKHAADLVDSNDTGSTTLDAFKSASIRLGMEPSVLVADTVQQIDDVIDRFASNPDAGLIIAGSGSFITNNHDAVHVALMRNRMPAVYGQLVYEDLGAVNYYIDNFDAIGKAAGYAGLILNGSKVSDLPIETPTKYILTVNQKTAKALNLTVPQSILLRADQVVQ